MENIQEEIHRLRHKTARLKFAKDRENKQDAYWQLFLHMKPNTDLARTELVSKQ